MTYGMLSTNDQYLARLIAYVVQKYQSRSIDVWLYSWVITEHDNYSWVIELTRNGYMEKFHVKYVSNSRTHFYRVFTAKGKVPLADVNMEEFLIDG